MIGDERVMLWCIAELAHLVRKLEGRMSENSDAIEAAAAANRAVEAQLVKAKAEIDAKIEALQAAVDAGEDLSAPLADLTASTAGLVPAAQAVDDIVPDAPVEQPVPEAPPVTPEESGTATSS